LCVADDLDESLRGAIDHCTIDVRHLDNVCAYVAACRARFAFRETDMCHFRIGEQSPRNMFVREGRLAGEQHVAYELHRLVGGDMRELHPAVNIAASPDSWRVRLQVLVDDDVGPIGPDSRGVQPELLDVAPPPGRNEDLVHCDLARFAALALDPCDLL